MVNKKQTSVAMSTVEAKYIAVGSCCAQILWMMNQRKDYDVSLRDVPITCDNTNAIAIMHNPVLHSRTKHIEIKHHFIRNYIERKDVKLEYVAIENQIADIFTKPLSESRFTYLRGELGMMILDNN